MKNLALIFILILAFGLRLYRLDFPLADWHSWRQADTAAVSRNFVNRGFELFTPRFDDLSEVASGLPNPEGYRFVEFPIYNLFHALLYKTYPQFGLEVWGRLLSIFFSLGSLIFLYLIVRRLINEKVALLSAFFFAVLPFNIYYSRTILPEPMMVFSSLGMIWFFIQWFDKEANLKSQNFVNFLLAIVFAGTSWLIKPFALVLLLPVAFLAWRKWRLNWRSYLPLTGGIIISLIPFLLWRWWMGHYPEGIPYSAPLFNLTKIRFKGSFFWWLFAERISKLILGGWGLILLGLGLIVKPGKKESGFFYFWLAAILVYFSIVAGGNVRHDYYQAVSLPILCVFLAKGADFLLFAPGRYFSRMTAWLLLGVVVLFTLAFSWYQVRDFFNINNPVIIEAGEAADRLLPENAKVIAPYGGDSAFLYQTKRQGWPVGIQIETWIEQGATHYVNVEFDEEVERLTQDYCLLEKTNHYVIIDLTKKCQE